MIKSKTPSLSLVTKNSITHINKKYKVNYSSREVVANWKIAPIAVIPIKIGQYSVVKSICEKMLNITNVKTYPPTKEVAIIIVGFINVTAKPAATTPIIAPTAKT